MKTFNLDNLVKPRDTDTAILADGTYICDIQVDKNNWYDIVYKGETQCKLKTKDEVLEVLEKIKINSNKSSMRYLVNHYFGDMSLLEEFSLCNINNIKQNLLEKIADKLRKYEALKDCVVTKLGISCKEYHLLFIGFDEGKMYFSNDFDTIWDRVDIDVLDVFEEITKGSNSIKIKEPLPHQARKKTLEELEVGDSYYMFSPLCKDVYINTFKYWDLITIVSDRDLRLLKMYISQFPELVALDEEEIKSKVLD